MLTKNKNKQKCFANQKRLSLCRKVINNKIVNKMKRLGIMIVPALICGMIIISCNTKEQEAKTCGELYAIGTKSAISETSSEEEIIFKGSDIEYYNITTGEIVFVNLTAENLLPKFNLFSKITLFLGEIPLYETVVVSPISSIPIDYAIVFLVDIDENKIFLQFGYPKMDVEIKSREWDMFIGYLSDNGKLKKSIDNGIYLGNLNYIPVPSPTPNVAKFTFKDKFKYEYIVTGLNEWTGYGTYSIKNDKIIFDDESRIEGTYQLTFFGEYSYTIDGNKLKFSNGMHEYDLEKQD